MSIVVREHRMKGSFWPSFGSSHSGVKEGRVLKKKKGSDSRDFHEVLHVTGFPQSYAQLSPLGRSRGLEAFVDRLGAFVQVINLPKPHL